jgi:hypothetical protein
MSLSITFLTCQSLALPATPAPYYAPQQEANGDAIEQTDDGIRQGPRQMGTGKHQESGGISEDQKDQAGAGESVQLLASVKEFHLVLRSFFGSCWMNS